MGQDLTKDVLKSARVMFGELCVMTSGILLMPVWPAGQLGFSGFSMQNLISYFNNITMKAYTKINFYYTAKNCILHTYIALQ